ncbi:ecdysone-inducible gene E3 [Andrena cerasifolii]|uniref:ecdysone-inducible gene E3 n=1 Tax=Andrena cerasifolii TaxID=2819439 RepID=UPI004037E4AC
MRVVCSLFVVLLFREAIGGVTRNPPAFAKPMYSDSYLPAAMQVIFHAVEQLKLLRAENATESSSTVTTPISRVTQYQQTGIQESSTISSEVTTRSNEETKGEDDRSKGVESSTKSVEIGYESMVDSASHGTEESSSHQEAPEVNEETPETNYATPEANYEAAEDVYGVQETNQEVPEENQEWSSSSTYAESTSVTETKVEATTESRNPPTSPLDQGESVAEVAQGKKKPTIESVVKNVYEIVKPTPSEFEDEDTIPFGESKISSGVPVNRADAVEEEDDENRFTRLGEKVTQVPRPSLISYLRRSKLPPSATLQQLANLYDSLSKDARKQGFGKYTGYSDEVLNSLETSAEGGIAPQLKKILDKVLERNELTRADAKTRTSQTIRDLDNPSATLSKELRTLLPLRYSP